MSVKVALVVVTYNNADDIAGCLRSIHDAAAVSSDVEYETVIVDNASQDETCQVVREVAPWAHLITRASNTGFARAANAGAAARPLSDFVLLLNPDTFLEPETVPALLSLHAARPSAGLYGGRTMSTDGRVDPRSCWNLPSVWSMTCFGLGLSTLLPRFQWSNPEALPGWHRDSIREVGVITGCLLLADRNAWNRLGGFDEDYFLYGEDADLGARAWGAGFRPTITPDATILHTVGASSASKGQKMVMVMRGKATFVRKRWKGPARFWGLVMLLVGTAVRAAPARAFEGRLKPQSSWTDWLTVWRRRSEWFGGYAIESARGRLAGDK